MTLLSYGIVILKLSPCHVEISVLFRRGNGKIGVPILSLMRASMGKTFDAQPLDASVLQFRASRGALTMTLLKLWQ
jgi:hypothetical protein